MRVFIVFFCALLLVAGCDKFGTSLSQPPAHGTEFIVEADVSKADNPATAMSDLQQVLQKRFSSFGLKVYLEPMTNSRLRVVTTLSGTSQVAQAGVSLFRNGYLAFRLVHDRSDDMILHQDAIPPGYEVLKQVETTPSGPKIMSTVVVRKKPEGELAGKIVKEATVSRDNLGQPEIDFTLDEKATTAFAEVTRNNIGRRLAIVVDGELISAPVINSPIERGSGMIIGRYTVKEAVQLAAALENVLPVPVTIVSSEIF